MAREFTETDPGAASPPQEVTLDGVPATMLWAVYNRAHEAALPGPVLADPHAIRIRDSIRYEFERSFGRPDGLPPMRARMFDDVLGPWIGAHPGATVVELAAGLETQCLRCDDGQVRWICIDLPEAIDVRERFIEPSERRRHIRGSALDQTWMDEVDATKGLFVTAQGLFMYFEEEQVRGLLLAIARRFPGASLVFDTIPRWFSRKTLRGWGRTAHYQVPPMPWGIDFRDLRSTLEAWLSEAIAEVHVAPCAYARGTRGHAMRLMRLPLLRNALPAVVWLRFSG